MNHLFASPPAQGLSYQKPKNGRTKTKGKTKPINEKKEPQTQPEGANKYSYLLTYHPTNQLINLPIKQ